MKDLTKLTRMEMAGESLRVSPPASVLEPGSAVVAFTLVYKWRPAVTAAWEVETPRWGKRMTDEEGLRRMARFSEKPFEELLQEHGIDLNKPDRAPRAGFGQEFYAALTAGETVLDAYFLGESDELGEPDDSPLGFYGKKEVRLYIKDTARVNLTDLAVTLCVSPPEGEYRPFLRSVKVASSGAICPLPADIPNILYLGEWEAKNLPLTEFPPEYLIETPAPPRPFAMQEPPPVNPIDPALIPAARRALQYITAVADAGLMLFGVQNYPYSKGGNKYPGAPQNTSDCFDLTGSDPSVFGFDSLSLVGHEGAHRMPEIIPLLSGDAADPENIPHYIRGSVLRSAEAWSTGAIPTISLHMGDPGMIYDDYVNGNKNRATGRPLYTAAGGRGVGAGGISLLPLLCESRFVRSDMSPGTDAPSPYPWNFHGYNYANSCRTALDPRDGRARSPHRPMQRLHRAVTGRGDATDNGTLAVYNAYLDLCAEYCLELQKLDIPVLFRPFHENSGDWFWWGNSGCEDENGKYAPELFITAWRHCVDYMKTKGVHNCLYVYSPNGSDFDNEEKLYTHGYRPFAATYPGDDYVDICAFDDYTQDENAMRGDVAYVANFAAPRGKPVAASEVTGSRDDPAVMDYLIRALTDTAHLPANVAFFLQWTPPGFNPYKVSPTRANSPAGNGFIKALGSKKILLAHDTRW